MHRQELQPKISALSVERRAERRQGVLLDDLILRAAEAFLRSECRRNAL